MDEKKAYSATPAATLEQHIMDPNIPKTEAEHWAAREITNLRQELIDMYASQGEEVDWRWQYVPAQPVAWMYHHPSLHEFEFIKTAAVRQRCKDTGCFGDGWTETPLYTRPAQRG